MHSQRRLIGVLRILTWHRAFWIVLLLYACQGRGTPVPKVPDDSLLTGQPCSPPCWQNLMPGQTSYQEAIVFLQQSPLVEGKVDAPLSGSAGISQGFWWSAEKVGGPRGNVLDFGPDGVLKFISLYPNTDITVGEVIQAYGVPDLLVLLHVFPYDPFSNQSRGVAVFALYRSRALLLDWFEERRDLRQGAIMFCPSLDILIVRAEYMTPERAAYQENALRDSSRFGNPVVEGGAVFQIENGELKVTCVVIS